jgi:hypothetical protein
VNSKFAVARRLLVDLACEYRPRERHSLTMIRAAAPMSDPLFDGADRRMIW